MSLRIGLALCVMSLGLSGFLTKVAVAQDQSAKPAVDEKFKIRAGGTLPFHVADFLSGEHKDHGGCPSAMMKNHKARGLLVWSKEVDDNALALVQATEKWIDGDVKQAYLVVFDSEEEALRKQLEKTPLKHASAGIGRHKSKQQLYNYDIDTSATQWVFLVDRHEVKNLWSLQAGELTKEKQQEILAAAEKHFAAK